MTLATSIRRFAAAAIALLGVVSFALPASAQLQPWEDFEPSDAVVEMTLVDLDEGALGTYLEGLKSTWLAANELAKELGHIEDYAIYGSQYGAADEFDLVLVVFYASSADVAPSRERYEAFLERWGEENMKRSNKKVVELYNKIRRIKGTYMLRKITVK